MMTPFVFCQLKLAAEHKTVCSQIEEKDKIVFTCLLTKKTFEILVGIEHWIPAPLEYIKLFQQYWR